MVGAVGLVAAGAAVVARLRRVTTGQSAAGSARELVVTVHRPLEELQDRALPEQLLALGDDVELELRPAPGDKGTEIAARIRTPQPSGAAAVAARVQGDDPRQAVRRALREAKSVIETGEVLEAQRARTTERTLPGALLDLVTRRSGGEGQL